jgi:carbon storage regulator
VRLSHRRRAGVRIRREPAIALHDSGIAFPRSWDYAWTTGGWGWRRVANRQRGKVHRPMLVLTRKSNQSIMIGDEIEVSVLSVMGEKVRIGIQAPQKIPVFRKEIYLEIHRETGAVIATEDGGVPADAATEIDGPLRELGEGS